MLVTGPTGSGKSSTLAAMIDLINETRAEHIITIEDPVEFLHEHKKGTVHQRELHSDTPTFALALRAALRQAPKVILVGEMRDRETMEIALTAAETGHLVLSTLHTIDASRTVDRIIGAFDVGDQQAIRTRLASSFRAFISQRLVPKKGGGRIAAARDPHLHAADPRVHREGRQRGPVAPRRDAATARMDGMQHFDGEIERLVRGGVISGAVGLLHATNPGNLRVMMADVASTTGRRRQTRSKAWSQALISQLRRATGRCLSGIGRRRAPRPQPEQPRLLGHENALNARRLRWHQAAGSMMPRMMPPVVMSVGRQQQVAELRGRSRTPAHTPPGRSAGPQTPASDRRTHKPVRAAGAVAGTWRHAHGLGTELCRQLRAVRDRHRQGADRLAPRSPPRATPPDARVTEQPGNQACAGAAPSLP